MAYTQENLHEACDRLESARRHCRRVADELLPQGSVVFRRDGEMTIYGIVHGAYESAPELVPVLHENGNVWARHAKELVRVVDDATWPEWIKEHKGT